MKVVELKEKNIDELLVTADELKAQIHQEQMDVAMNKKQNAGTVKKAKKDLARVMTVIKEKQAKA